VNGNLRRSLGFRAMHKFAERELALFAVARAEGIAEVGFLVFLEELHGFARGVGISFALVGAREAELSGGVIRSEGNSLFECGDGVVVLLELRIEKAYEVVGVGLVGSNLCDVLEGFDSLLRLVEIFVGETEVVPGVGIVGKLGAGLFESGAALLQFLLTEEGDTEIDASDGEFRIDSESFLKIFLRFRTFLLVEKSDAERVEAQSFRGSGWAIGGRSLGGIRMQG